MAKTHHITDLLGRIEADIAYFGRAQTDIEAMCARARIADYRGVLQNARLVTETLLRAIVVKEKKEDPGRSTLESLLKKLHQPGQDGAMPTHIVVHMRTIQAWGNASAHDHDAALEGKGLEVSEEEAFAGLNSMAVILGWYRQNYLLDAKADRRPSSIVPMPAPKPQTATTPVFILIAIFLASGAAGAYVYTRTPADRTALDAAHASAAEPPPPTVCQATADIESLATAARALVPGKPNGQRAEDRAAVEQLAKAKDDSAERNALLAKAYLFAGDLPAARTTLKAAMAACPDYATLHAMQGSLHLLENNLEAAQAAYTAALERVPSFVAPRFNLGLVHLKSGRIEDAIRSFSEVIERDPAHALAYQTRGAARASAGELQSAQSDLQEALRRMPGDATAIKLLKIVEAKLGAAAPH